MKDSHETEERWRFSLQFDSKITFWHFQVLKAYYVDCFLANSKIYSNSAYMYC